MLTILISVTEILYCIQFSTGNLVTKAAVVLRDEYTGQLPWGPHSWVMDSRIENEDIACTLHESESKESEGWERARKRKKWREGEKKRERDV